MAKSSGESKRSGGSKGVAFNPNGQRNVNGKFKRAALMKLYGLVAVLLLTLGLIAILEYAQRSLPGASKTHFNPFETGTQSSSSTAFQTAASEKTNFVTLTKRQVATPGPTPGSPTSPLATVLPSSVALSSLPASSAAPPPALSTSSASFSSAAPPPPSPSDSLPAAPPSSNPPVSSSPPPSISPPVSSSPPGPPPSPLPCPPGDTALSCLSPSAAATPSANATSVAPPVVTLVGTPTDIFVPVVVSSVVAPAVCTASAVSSPSCTCPFNSEVPNCQCTPDPTISVCQCTFKFDATGVEYQDCICAPDTCTTCQAPFGSNGASSFLTPAACPPVPFQAGCSCSSLGATELCSNTVQCDCGTSVRAAQCANSILPAAPPPGVIQVGTTLVANITTPTLVANITTPSVIANATSPALPPALSVNVTSVSSSTSSGAILAGIASSSISIASSTPPVLVLITSSSTSLGPSGPNIVTVLITPTSRSSTPVSISPSVNTLGQTIVSVASRSSTVTAPIVSLSTGTNFAGQPTTSPVTLVPVVPIVSLSVGTNSAGQPTTVPVTLAPAAPVVSLSIGTNSVGQPTTVPVTLNAAAPIITLSVGTNSAGQPTTVPVTISPAAPIVSLSVGTNAAGQPTTVPVTLVPVSAVPTGVVFFVSNSISTSSGTPVAVAVTVFKATVDPSSPIVTDSSGQIFTVPTALLQTEAPIPTPTLISGSQTATASGSAGAGGSGGSSGGSSSSDPVKVAILAWPTSKTLLGGYVPVLVAKLYQMGMGSRFRFPDLSTFANDYIKSIHNQAQDLAPFNSPSIRTLFGGPDPMSLFTLAPYLVSWAIIPFASDSIFFDTNYGCANPNPATPANPCWPPRMTANTWVIRVLQGFLSVTAAIALALIAIWFKKPHGATNDPTSIAAVAAIASHPDVVRDFSCAAEATSNELKASLKGKKYNLNEYQTADGTVRYGMVPASIASSDSPATQAVAKPPSKFGAIFKAGWKTIALTKDVVYLCYLFAILAITAAYLRDIDKSPIAKMFEGSTVGRRIVFALLAAIASVYFSAMERDMQTLAPYMDLQHLDATPTPTILLRKHTLPLTSFIPMLRNRHLVPALVAFVAVLSEFLVITLSGLPYRPGQLRSEFYFCAISSLTILVLMLAIVVVVNIWRRFLPHLPRKPDTVANVLSYVVGTKMCDDFEGLEKLKVSERDKRIKALGKRYGYGRRGDGEVERWVVDEGAEREVERGLRLETRGDGLRKGSSADVEEVGVR